MSIIARLNPFRLIRFPFWMLSFYLKRLFGKVDYLLINIPPDMRAMPTKRNWIQRRILGEPPLSLYELREIFDRVAADPNCKGVVLYLREIKMGIANGQTLRQAMLDLKARGKRVVAYANDYDSFNYYVATAASDVLIGPWGVFAPTGIRMMVTYMHDALDAIGVEVDAIAISPYKAAGDQLTMQEMTSEFKEQADWLFDSIFDQVCEDIGAARNMTRPQIEEMVARAPLAGDDAIEAGYVDGECAEEDLGAYLDTEHIIAVKDGVKRLTRRWKPYRAKKVVVLHVEGTMIEGESVSRLPGPSLPFISEARMGNITVVQKIRNLAKERRVAAVVLHIESNGGSTACALPIARALQELNKDKPLVICMNNIAASGGYVISTPGRWIVARPGTVTGSIGVVMFKFTLQNMYEKLRINPVELSRGESADFNSNVKPWTEEQTAQAHRLIAYIYEQFVAQVAASRGMSTEAVDAVAEGRVWMGVQARDHGLVDELGGLPDAIRKAREFANLPADAPVEIYQDEGKPLGPQFAADPAAALHHAFDAVTALEGVQMLMPVTWRMT